MLLFSHSDSLDSLLLIHFIEFCMRSSKLLLRQAAYILYPPDHHEWDPCAELRHTETASHMQHDMEDDGM